MYGEDDDNTGFNARLFTGWDVLFWMLIAAAFGACIGALLTR